MTQTDHRTGHRFAAIAVGLLLSAIPTTSVLCAQDAVQWRVEDGGNGHWYQVIGVPERVRWDDALDRARASGGDLASINSPEENALVRQQVIEADLWCGENGVWLGGHKPDQDWVWTDGSSWNFVDWCGDGDGEDSDDDPLARYLQWLNFGGAVCWDDHQAIGCWETGNGGPGYVLEYSADCNGDGIVDYGQILDGTLSDENGNGIPDCCDQGVCLPPVQWRVEDGGNGHWYGFLSAPGISWSDAQMQAQIAGGHLATLVGPEENAFVSETYASDDARYPWIGLIQSEDGSEPDGGWSWATGEPLDWTNWAVGEPGDDGGINADHGNIWLKRNDTGRPVGTWNDWVTGIPNGGIIEWSADCNGDGIVDYGQILDGTFRDDDGNWIPDCCDSGEPCAIQWRTEDGGNGHWYSVVRSGEISFPDARNEARALDGDLGVVDSEALNQWIVDTFLTDPDAWRLQHGPWIGLYQDRSAADYTEPAGGWYWVNGAPLDFADWAQGTQTCEQMPAEARCDGQLGCDFANYYTLSSSVVPVTTWGSNIESGDSYQVSYLVEWSSDCNGDGIVDYGQILEGSVPDCDGNGVPDDCERTDSFAASEPRTPINTDDVIEFDVSGMADAADAVTVTVSALGDYQAFGSLLILELVSETGSTFSEILFGFDGEDCTVMSTTLQIPAAAWNQAGLNGDRMIEISGTSIQPTLCEPDRLTAIAVEVPIAFQDCNDNGLWDACEISDGSALDSDGDGVIDDCDGCPTDPEKADEGLCGCGTPDTDSDGDGTPDCLDDCPEWPHACSEDGQTLFVSVDQSIQGAIDGVPAGGVISLNEGTFTLTTSLDPGGKDITLRGQVDVNGDPTSILDGQNGCRVMDITNGETLNTVLENLVFRNGNPGSGEGDHGGAIRLFNSDATIRHCRFEQNQSTNYGGAIVIHDDDAQSETTIENCVFMNNRSVDGAVPSGVGGRGGAIAIYRGDPTITGCTFTGNIADDEGGAIHSNEADPMVTNCDFIENEASNERGGGFFGWQSGASLSDCLFLMNRSQSDGGGACFDSLGAPSTPSLVNCTFEQNEVFGQAGSGGLQCVNQANATLSGCSFLNNTSNNGGAGILAYGSMLTIEQTTFSGNVSGENGGGLWMYLGSLTATDCTFSDNTANDGGGIYARNLAQFSLENCTLNTNTAHGSYGGAIFNEASTLSLENCVVDGNTASSRGGAIYNKEATTNATNTRFESNESNSEGGAIWWNGGGAGTLVQCDFINNRVTDGNGGNKTGGALWYRDSAITATNCAFQGNTVPGSGGAIFQLPNSSPAIVLTDNTICDNSSPQIAGGFTDAGNCITDTCDSDLDGTLDCIDGCPDDPDKIEPEACGCGAPETDTDADGLPDCVDPCPEWPNDCSEDGQTLFVAVGESIQNAINLVPAGGTVEIAAGSHTPGAPLDTQGRPMTIIGAPLDADGLPTTMLDGQETHRVLQCVSGEGPDTVFENLWISGGAAIAETAPEYRGGGMYNEGSSPTLRSCWFVANTTSNDGGGMANYSGSSPILQSCVFLDNTARFGGALANSNQSNPLLSDCTVENNEAIINGGGLYSEVESVPELIDSVACGNLANQIAGGYDDLGGNCILEDCGSDLDENGVPDGCDPDCNGDGIPDGLETDCDSDGVPDDCAIADGLVEDCNANGIPDTCDITDGDVDDFNGNDVPDECEYASGDLNLDGCIGGADLAILLSLWGLENPPIGDFNDDGTVGGADLATLLANWDPCG